MKSRRKSYAQLLVEKSTGREIDELLRDLYVDRRHSQQEIAAAISATGAPVSRTLVSQWLSEFGITRDERPAVAL